MCVDLVSEPHGGHYECNRFKTQCGCQYRPFPLTESDPVWIELAERLGSNHLAMIVERSVNLLDRRDIDACYSGQGARPFDPIPLLKVVLFEYLQGNLSPATWTEEAKLNEAVRFLARGYEPGRRTWYEFRDRASKFIDRLHVQIIKAAIDDELLDSSVGVLDGTFVAACASRHRLVNLPTLNAWIEQLDAIMKSTCNEEDNPKWVPSTPSGKGDLANRMALARNILYLFTALV